MQNQHDMIRVKHDIYGLAINVADSEKKLCSFVPQFLSLHRNLGGVKGGKRLRCAMKSRVTLQSDGQQSNRTCDISHTRTVAHPSALIPN